MARLLALEWDAREARVAVARVRGREAVIEHAFAVDLGPRDPGQTFADRNVGEQIAAALAARNVGRCDTLVAVGRASIELRQLSLPPSPEEELPDLVRFQAMRQFTGIGEDWPLDFVRVDVGESESLNVLAAAISPELVEQIRTTCQAGELVPRRLVLRPFAAASLLRRRKERPVAACCLMVDLLADEADLTVLVDEQVCLVRTVRLSTSEEAGAASRALLGEIRRTIAAAHNQIRERRVEGVILCGSGTEQAALGSLIEQELGQRVEYFDPFSDLHLHRDLQAHKPSYPGRFAPLLGMIMDEATRTGHPIDFLHPRKRPEPPSCHRQAAVLGAVAALALLAAVFLIWRQLAALDRQIANLTAALNRDKKVAEEAKQLQDQTATIDEFVESDIPWLDELSKLSRNLPSADQVLVTQLNLSLISPKGGQIIVDGYTREFDQVQKVSDALRSGGRDVVSSSSSEDPKQTKYRWKFKQTAIVPPQPVPGAPAAPAAAGGKSKTKAGEAKAAPAARKEIRSR